MEAIATAKVAHETAKILTDKIRQSMAEFIADPPVCECEEMCSCTARYWGSATDTKGKIIVRQACTPDWTGATFGWRIIPGGIEFWGNTCGGYRHALRIFLDGKIEAEHRGARASGGSIMFDHLPQMWWDIRSTLKWELTTYKSSRPEWAVKIALLPYPLGKAGAPTCLAEEEAEIEAEIETAMKEKYNLVGRTWPQDIYYGDGEWHKKTDWDGSAKGSWFAEPYKIPAWTGLEYRRASAMGISL